MPNKVLPASGPPPIAYEWHAIAALMLHALGLSRLTITVDHIESMPPGTSIVLRDQGNALMVALRGADEVAKLPAGSYVEVSRASDGTSIVLGAQGNALMGADDE